MGKSTISMGELRLCWKPAFMFVRASTRCAFEQRLGGVRIGGSDGEVKRATITGGPKACGCGGDLGTMLHQTVSKVRKIQNI